jgi:hypothetical protein
MNEIIYLKGLIITLALICLWLVVARIFLLNDNDKILYWPIPIFALLWPFTIPLLVFIYAVFSIECLFETIKRLNNKESE